MEFVPSDWDWSDLHKGLSAKRRKRYEAVIEGILDGLEQILREHHERHALVAVVDKRILSKGVRGDGPMYAPVVFLFADYFPGYPFLARISSAITNNLPVSRVAYCLSTHVKTIGDMAVLDFSKP